jgi:RNA-directed DNA polymerase
MSQIGRPGSSGKSYDIPKMLIWEAYRKVKGNKGAAGVDGQSLADFAQDERKNLYKIWNRMCSGSYFPPPVRAVEIGKAGGNGVRVLGVPTVADRIAQTAVAMVLEPQVEPMFHPDSYGYRPRRSALDAVQTCRARCWETPWVIDLDIQGFFDNVPHGPILAAVAKHTDKPWVSLYVQRWLTAPLQRRDGALVVRDRGTPQGSLCSAEHKDPYEQCWVMRSVGLSGLVRALLGGRALRITFSVVVAHSLVSQVSSPGSWFHSGRSLVTMSV